MRKIIEVLSLEMNRPKSYGIYHFIWIGLIIISLVYIYKNKTKYSENQLKKFLIIYGVGALLLEIIKQIIWSYDLNTNVWKYTWYAAPFQLCTTPIYASLIAAFTKNKKIKKTLLAYISYITILGSIATIIYPESCFVRTIEVNIHTMFLHCGSFVLSIYLLSNEIEANKKNFINSILSFLVFESIALLLNIIIYNIGILNGETFNMFYISPYFVSPLPVMDYLQAHLPYIIYLLAYNFAIILGGYFIYTISKFMKKMINDHG